ncbi:MAG: hypothetical protein SXA11_07430 [Cyanobacteriota bacterium]|nr:hypothetical protein [Cyanobacteriota bacterium]
MTDSNKLEKISAYNEEYLDELKRTLQLSQGSFTLIYCRCNYDSLQGEILESLRVECPVNFEVLELPASATNLYSKISDRFPNNPPDALMVLGLESVVDLERLLAATNNVRDAFLGLPFPVVIWGSDALFKMLRQLAADFNSFTGAPIPFSLPDEELGALICDRVDAAVSDAANFQIKSAEIKALEGDLEEREWVLDGESGACFTFLLGWDLARSDRIDAAVDKYRKCREFWMQNNNFERQGLALLNLGLVLEKKGEDCWQEARDCLRDCLACFESAKREDLVGKYLGFLGEMLVKLNQWDELKVLAEKGLNLHESLGEKRLVARDYGWLAEVALHQSRWREGADFARKALAVDDSEIMVKERGLFGFLLGQSLAELGKVGEAISYLKTAGDNLEFARQENLGEYDAKLHVEILTKLRVWQLEEKQYLAAFNNKQLQRQIETQYGWRAFVGAARLEPPVINLPGKTAAEKRELVRQIEAFSGRKADLERLVERMKNPKHKLTIIHGQSGVGKSSILQAGLIPTLQLTYFEGRDYVPVSVRFYKDWVNSLGQELVEVLNLDRVDLSPEWILSQLRENEHRGLLTILVFDQFEEFFFDNPDADSRREFYRFLEECLRIPYLKVILSLREDYIYYLLEFDRQAQLNIDKNYEDILYYLGNFSRDDARGAINNLTERSKISLESDLVEELVADLAREFDGVRPIEFQVVGAELETEEIRTLKRYRELGEEPKEILVERFLEEAVKDCGEENQRAAELVLFLLTNTQNTRPLKTKSELKEDLEQEGEKLDLVLEVLVDSGLVLEVPETPENFYQLVHDYLVSFVRRKYEPESLELQQEREEKRRWQKLTIRGSIAVSLIMTVLAITSETYRGLAQVAEIKALNTSSEALFSANKQLDALVSSVRAGKTFKEISPVLAFFSPQKELEMDTKKQLAEVFRNIQESNRLEKHTNEVFEVSFSPDGETLASAGYDDTVKLWSSNGTLLQNIEDHEDDVIALSFSPNGNIFASASADGKIKLWRKENDKYQEFQELLGHDRWIFEVNFSFDNLSLASGGQDTTVKLWNLLDVTSKDLGKHDLPVNSVSFSPRGELASASCYAIKLWSPRGTFIKDFALEDEDKCVRSIDFSPDGELLASGGSDPKVKLWSRDGKLLKTLEGHSDRVLRVVFSPDRRTLASAGLDKTIILWHRSGTKLATLRGHTKAIFDLSFSPDGIIASAGEDASVRLWKYENSLLKSFREPGEDTENILDAKVNSKGQILVLLASGDVLELWTMDGNLETTFPEKLNLPNPGQGASLSPDGKTLASFKDRQVKLWSIDGRLLQTLPKTSAIIVSVVFSPDGRFLASFDRNGNIYLWSVEELAPLSPGAIATSDKDISRVSFSPDAKLLVSATKNGNMKIWRLTDAEMLESVPAHEQNIYEIRFSPNGQMIATASADNTVKLWSFDGTYIITLAGHNQRVWSVNFSPDSKIVASASLDNTIKLWSLDGTELQSIHEQIFVHKGDILFAPNGKQLVVTGHQTANLWELDREKLENLVHTLNDLDKLLEGGCNWLKDYLQTNGHLSVCDEF